MTAPPFEVFYLTFYSFQKVLLAYFYYYFKVKEMVFTAEKVVTLHDKDLGEGTLYRLQRGTLLRLQPGPSLLGKHITLYTNYLGIGESVVIGVRLLVEVLNIT